MSREKNWIVKKVENPTVTIKNYEVKYTASCPYCFTYRSDYIYEDGGEKTRQIGIYNAAFNYCPSCGKKLGSKGAYHATETKV